MISLHDVLQLLQLLTAQVTNQLLKFLQLLWIKRLLLLWMLDIVILISKGVLRSSLGESTQDSTEVGHQSQGCNQHHGTTLLRSVIKLGKGTIHMITYNA